MKRVLIYVNTTDNVVVDKQMESILVGYCKHHDYEIVGIFGENTSRTGMSEPTAFMAVGMAVTDTIDAVVTMFAEMVGNSKEAIVNTLQMLDDFNILVETVLDDMDEYYEALYSNETHQEEEMNLETFVERMKDFFNMED